MTWPTDSGTTIFSSAVSAFVESDVPTRYFAGGSLAGPQSPTVTLVSPAAGTPLRTGDVVVFDVTSSTPFHLEAFTVRAVATGEREAAYDRTAPAGAWDPRYAGSRVEQLAATHYRLHLRRATWPGGGIGILPRVSNAGGVAS